MSHKQQFKAYPSYVWSITEQFMLSVTHYFKLHMLSC